MPLSNEGRHVARGEHLSGRAQLSETDLGINPQLAGSDGGCGDLRPRIQVGTISSKLLARIG